MTYFEGFIAPVPEANRDAYRKHASEFASLTPEFGIGRHLEAWDSDVPEGKLTDFRKAVDAKPDEKVVLAFFEYPDKQAREAANQKLMLEAQKAPASRTVEIGRLKRGLELTRRAAAGHRAMRPRPFDPTVHFGLTRCH